MRLSNEEKLEIKNEILQGNKPSDVAEKHGVSESTAYRCLRGQ